MSLYVLRPIGTLDYVVKEIDDILFDTCIFLSECYTFWWLQLILRVKLLSFNTKEYAEKKVLNESQTVRPFLLCHVQGPVSPKLCSSTGRV